MQHGALKNTVADKNCQPCFMLVELGFKCCERCTANVGVVRIKQTESPEPEKPTFKETLIYFIGVVKLKLKIR
jgi:hypothetical protein